MGTMRLVVDRPDQALPVEVSVDRLGEWLADPGNRLWLDISDPGPAEVELLRREFSFHELTLEEMTRPHERPRCDAHGGYYFVVVYFGDVQDHALHVLAEMDTYRDLLGAALDVQVFYSFNRLGHIMRRLTAVTVIIIVPNFVASIYGMNFDHLLPPSEWKFGFIAVVAFLGCMVAWGFIHSRMLRWL